MTDIRELEQWIAAMDNRLRVVESIISTDNAKKLADTVEQLERIVKGDDDLGVPPIMEQLRQMVTFHDNIKAIITGLVAFDFIMLIVVTMIVIFVR